MSRRAWVTLATNDSYGLGALVLAHSLRRVRSTHSTVVLITPSVTDAMRDRLRAVFTEVVTVDVLDSRDAAHLALLQRPELGITFTKIHCWGLTQYEKCVFLDADTLVVQNCDELFEREELSAAPDVGWPDCFNSGVFVYRPSTATFDALIKFAQERGSFDGGDQGLLNSFFSDWARGDINKHLPFLYNVTSAAFYSYLPALKHYGQDLKIIHFIGAAKPWLQPYNFETRSVSAPGHLQGLLQLWWDLFVGQVHHQLDTSMVEDVEVEAPPMPAPDAQHYEPSLDQQSEFPWHHPDAQLQDEAVADKPDLTDFYDPWQNYKGNIPPNPNPEVSDDHKSVRDYAWEYKAPAHTDAWQPSAGQHDTHWHHEPHHHTHNHHHRDHSGDHSHTHTHHTDEHNGWYHHHEAGQSFTNHETPHHHHSQNHHNHGQTHAQYPHDHHYDHTSHPHHDHKHSEKTHESSNSKWSLLVVDFDHTLVDTSQVHVVHHAHIDYDNERENGEAGVPVAIKDMNGDASETESCDHEDIKPRHPYDNYYLKHICTIDSYGRKICSHEIPPTPSPSLSPEYMTPDDSEEEDEPLENQANQSGVAANLARVVPGAVAREALDELTRRQGWEAGNIDYMGADSFANIWAKISQTLNQPRASPPKEQPKQPSPPKEAAKQPSPLKEAPKQPSPPKEAPKQPSPPKEAPKQRSPPKEPAPEQPSPPKETPAEVKPAEAKPAEAPVEAKLAEVPAAEPVAEAAGKPTPPVSPAAEAPVVATAAAPAQAASAPAAEPPKEEIKEKTDKPEVPPTPPATPKSTPEPSTPVDEAPPAVEALLAAAPAAPGVPAVPATPATPAAPVSPAPVAKAPASPAAPATPAAPAVPAAPAAPATPATPAAPAVPTAPAAPVTPAAPASPAPAAEAPASPAAPAAATPEKTLDVTSASSDSPPLANTPSKDDAPVDPAAKSEERERRKKVEKLQLSPPAAADTLATPDSELEDAAALAHAIIASELAPSDPPAPTVAPAVSLAQIGVKPKGKSTAAQIESSVAPATPSAQAPAKPNAAAPSTPTAAAPATPSSEAPAKPSAATPATLSTKASAISVAVAPSTTSSKASATPRAAAPATPVADAPATPSAASPSFTRSSKAPATPSAAAPATPAAEASATPSAAAPATPSTPSSEAPATPTSEPSTPSAETPSTPTTAEATKEAPKKKVVKKVVKKEGDAPVPPPRKKEKKPKE
ncbi:nascent polypeptide-associated complex subunit alpha, muscle-specific form-like isoform X2 [Cydia strobilella]|uniref:nascent polypeptide-associated complex subunit alpha, muscle-specific form-like isoform X2 n=1 Tax=Cydia strobilella TaxID=1100964 RepID=UPI0030076914